MKEMKVENKRKEEKEEVENGYPNRTGEPDCLYYMKTGLCGYGSSCRFNHPPLSLDRKATQDRSELPQREGQIECGYYMKTGTCRYGLTCKYHHPLDRRQSGNHFRLNSLGLPIRQEEKSCPYYMRNYTCKFGPACKFNHPEFPSTMPMPPSIAARTMGSFFPSSFVPYDATLQAWPMTNSLYMDSLRAPFPPTYVPLGYPSLPDPVVAQSWNGFMGNMSPVSASSFTATNMAYSHYSQGELAIKGKVDMSTMSIPQLPERPGQPQCWYFMSIGSCRYGSNCKFHHPKERVAQLAMSCIGPHGLPLRPGEEICGDYRSHGLCKHGPTCRFDHPFGYLGGWYFGMSPQPMADNLPVSNHRNPTIATSSDTPQSKSSEITDWIQKPESVEDTYQQNADAKVIEDSNEPVEDQPNAAASSDELP